MKIRLTILAFVAVAFTASANSDLKLRYDRPAIVFEEALVIGNGTTGGIIYGGTETDRISLNDITLWTGEPDTAVSNPDAHKAIPAIRQALEAEDYALAEKLQQQVQGQFTQSYMPLGFMTIEWADTTGTTTDYQRTLDIANSIATTTYRRNGHTYTTTYFASAPDQLMVIRLTTDNPSGINATIRLDSQLPCTATASGSNVAINGHAAYHSYPNYYQPADNNDKLSFDPSRGTRFTAQIKARTENGTVAPAGGNALKIQNASDVTLLVATGTSFNGYDKNPATMGVDEKAIAASRINRATAKSYAELLATHQADYHSLFDRVKITLGATDSSISSLPTDKRLLLYTTDSIADPELESMYFQFGRYLLISCSRTPGVPANLQGLWNEKMLPPWSCNYTININAQENYWPAETTGLGELHRPLLDLILNMSQGSGQATAKAYYGVDKGWCAGHNTDIWAMTCPVGLGTGSVS
ncbi:MAG: glycoside hydrolase family 95 protein [Muribaculaceae bacterium]|nr:glycoside hydrolase family 95 protein [Muribaculaceae bacterium]